MNNNGDNEKNISIQDVKLKIKPIKTVANEKQESPSAQFLNNNERMSLLQPVSDTQDGKNTTLNFIDTQKEKTQKIVLKKTVTPSPVINLNEINIKSENSSELSGILTFQEKEKPTDFNDFEVVPSSNGTQHISDTVKLRLKPKTTSTSAFSTLATEEKSVSSNISDQHESDFKDTAGPVIDTSNKSVKYFFIIGVSLLVIIVLVYLLVSTVKTLITI